ncbi:MAG: septal ring lytic transglycosylase RlpA family protein [Candidatus Aminicenantes bacterium]
MRRSPLSQRKFLLLLVASFLLSSCAGMHYFPTGSSQRGMASWYGEDFHGKQTSNKEIYDMHTMTAAHKTLPFGTHVRVTNLNNGKSVVVRINDRGPFVKGRIIDLSYAAAQRLGMAETGVAPVVIKVLKRFSPKKSSQRYAVQVGSFAEKRNAKILRAKLERNYDNVYIAEHKTPSQVLYRVRIRTRSMKAAQKIVERLHKKGHSAHILEEY